MSSRNPILKAFTRYKLIPQEYKANCSHAANFNGVGYIDGYFALKLYSLLLIKLISHHFIMTFLYCVHSSDIIFL